MAEAPVVKLGAALAAVLFFAARAANACPACATRGSGGITIPLLLGAMILTPYLVATVVLRIVRKAEAAGLSEGDSSNSPPFGRSTPSGVPQRLAAAPSGGDPWRSPTGDASLVPDSAGAKT